MPRIDYRDILATVIVDVEPFTLPDPRGRPIPVDSVVMQYRAQGGRWYLEGARAVARNLGIVSGTDKEKGLAGWAVTLHRLAVEALPTVGDLPDLAPPDPDGDGCGTTSILDNLGDA